MNKKINTSIFRCSIFYNQFYVNLGQIIGQIIGQCAYILALIFLFSERHQWLIEGRNIFFEDLTKFDSVLDENFVNLLKLFETYFFTTVKTDNKNPISANFDPKKFQLYMKVDTHL